MNNNSIYNWSYQKLFEALKKIYALGPNPSLAYKMDANRMIIQDVNKNAKFINDIAKRLSHINRMLTSVRSLISEYIYSWEKEFFEAESKLEKHLMDHIEITDATEKTHKLTDMRIEGEHK